MILTLRLLTCEAYTITDVSKTPGITHVKLPSAFILDNYYTITFYIDYHHYYNALIQLENNLYRFSKLDMYKTTLNLLKLTKSQFSIINTPTLPHLRNKRGIINGLGKAINWLTGNMDADDKSHYDQLLQKLEENNYAIEHNIEHQAQTDIELIRTFQKDIALLNSNINKVKTINSILSQDELQIHLLELHGTILYIYNKILSLEMTIEQCSAGKLHHSVLTHINFASFHNATFISNQLDILWLTSKATCALHEGTLHIFLQVPLQSKPVDYYLLL